MSWRKGPWRCWRFIHWKLRHDHLIAPWKTTSLRILIIPANVCKDFMFFNVFQLPVMLNSLPTNATPWFYPTSIRMTWRPAVRRHWVVAQLPSSTCGGFEEIRMFAIQKPFLGCTLCFSFRPWKTRSYMVLLVESCWVQLETSGNYIYGRWSSVSRTDSTW